MYGLEREQITEVVRKEIDKKNMLDTDEALSIIGHSLFIFAMFIFVVSSLICSNAILKILEILEATL